MEDTLAKINKAGLKLLETMTPEETYKVIVDEAISLVAAEYGSVFLGQEDAIIRVYASHVFFDKIKARKEGYVKTAFKKNKVIINPADTVAKVHPIIKEMGIQSIVLLPLSYRGESIGVLALHSLKKEHFSQKEIDILRLFGSMATLAIKKSQMYSETKKALEIRDMFISMAAHELRTPLTSINGYIQLLHGKMANREGVEGKWMKELYEESKRLTTLVKELLEVNRLKTGQIQFMWQECSVVNIMKTAIDEMRILYPEREISFENKIAGTEDLIIGDASKLEKVFTNIIDNGLKYSPKATKVLVTISEKSGFIVTTIKDTGRGIDEKNLPHIFEGHQQGGGGEEGMGIGLFFVENVVRQHRGVISVKSKLKKGTTFEVKLPKAKYGK